MEKGLNKVSVAVEMPDGTRTAEQDCNACLEYGGCELKGRRMSELIKRKDVKKYIVSQCYLIGMAKKVTTGEYGENGIKTAFYPDIDAGVAEIEVTPSSD